MFESVVRTVLNKFLGDYVSNLETNQLNVGIFSGNVELSGLKLRREALDKLNLPIFVYQGYLGKLQLQIPWTNLKQQPVVVTISDMFILAGPRVQSDVNEAEEAEKAFRRKLDRIETAELFDLDAAMHGEAAEKVIEETQNESFTTQLVNKIIDNVQVHIKNIHFRFEDNLSHPNSKLFSFGFTLENLAAFSANSGWEEAFVADATDKIFKIVDLESLSIYWDSWSGASLRDLSQEEFERRFLELIRLEEDRNHVLCPITGQAKIEINKKKRRGEPKTKVNLLFDQFALLFDNSQYFDLLSLLNFFVLTARLRENSKFRPVDSKPSEKPQDWFRYLVNASLAEVREKNRKRSWSYIMQRRKDRDAYTDVFFQKLQAGENPLLPEIQKELDDMERRLEYRDLRLYRKFARRQFQKFQETNKQKRMSQGWLEWLMSPSEADTKPTSIADLVKDTDIQELYDTIDFQEEDEVTADADPNEQLFQVDMDVGLVSLNIGKSNKGETASVASLVLRLFSGSFVKHASAMKAELALQELVLQENLLQDSLFKEIIRSRTTKFMLEYDDDAPFFHLVYDELASNPDAQAALTLTMQPLEIIVNHQAAALLKEFLLGGKNKALIDNLIGLASDQISQFQVWTKSSLEHALSQHKGIDFFIDIDAPIIVVPEDSSREASYAYVADLGHVKVRSKLVTAQQKEQVTDIKGGEAVDRVKLHDIKELLYDYLLASLSNLQLLYFDNLKDCTKMLREKGLTLPEESLITDKVNLDLQIGSCILPPNSELPDTKIRGSVPMVEVFFSDEKYKNFMKLLDIFLPPSPQGDEALGMNFFNSSTTSLFDLMQQPSGSPPLMLPQPKESADASDEDEFQDAVENPEDLRIAHKHYYDQTSLDMSFVIDHVRGHVSRRLGQKQEIGLIEVDSLRVLIENRPWDIVVRTYLKAFRVTELLQTGLPRLLVDGHKGEESEGLLQVSVTLVNPLHPLFKTKYGSAGISVDVDISRIDLMMDPPTIMHLIRYVTDTFPKGDEPVQVTRSVSKRQSVHRLERGLSRLSYSASTAKTLGKSTMPEPVPDVDPGKIFVNIRLLELCVALGPDTACIGQLDLKQAAIGVTYEGPGKILLVGKLASFEIIPKDLGIGPYTALSVLPFATVEGESVVDFSYQTFVPEDAAKEGHDVALKLTSGSMRLCYMPHFLRHLFDLLAGLREATSILNSGPTEVSIDDSAAASRFHYEVNVLSPVIILASPADPEERLAFYPGNLNVFNTFRMDEDWRTQPAWDTLINVHLRAVHIDVWRHVADAHRSVRKASLAAPMDVEVRVTQAHSPAERHYAPMEVEVSFGKVRFSLGDAEYTLAMGLLNWFLATYPTVMDRIQNMLTAGSPVASPVAPVAADGDDPFTMEVIVMMDLLEAAVYTNDDAGGETTPLSDLSFRDVAVDYLAHVSGSYSVEGRSQLIGLTDSRPDPLRCFKSLLRQDRVKQVRGIAKDPEAPMLLARYERLLPRRQIVTRATLDSPQLLLVLDHLFALKKFFADGLPTAPLFVDPVTNASVSTEPDVWSTSTMVSLARASVYLLEDPHRPDSEAIELSIPELMYTHSAEGGADAANGGHMTLTLDDLSMALLDLDRKDETRLHFLDPFDLIMTAEPAEKDPGLVRNTVQLTPIVMRFAQQDLALFQALLARFAALSSDQAPAPPPVEEAIDQTIARMAMDSPPPAPHPRSPSVQKAALRTIYKLQMESFRAVLVDDLSRVNRPFIECLVRSLSGEFVQPPELPLTGRAEFEASLSAFNVANSHWEPLMETLQMVLTMQPESAYEDDPTAPAWFSKMTLRSQQGLEAVFSHAFLEQANAYIARVSALAGERILSAERETTPPYVIHNYTGCPISFWVAGNRRSTLVQAIQMPSSGDSKPASPTKDGKIFRVGPGEKLPWSHQDWRTLRSSTETVVPMLACRLEETPFQPVQSIAIDSTGLFAYALRPGAAGPGEPIRRLVVEIVVKGGVKNVYLRPPFLYSNDGKFILEAQCGEQVLEIQPGRTGSFPIGTPMLPVQVRPKDLDYGWSADGLSLTPGLFAHTHDLLQLSCTHLTDTHLHPPFYYSVYGEIQAGFVSKADEEDAADVNPLSHLIGMVHLRAPLQFMNQLPYRLTYRIFDRTCGFDFGASLAPGAVAQLHFVNALHVIGLSLEIPDADLRSTEISLINDAEGEILDSTLPMIDGERKKVALRFAFAQKKGGTRRVILYAPYSILNLTGLPFAMQNNTVIKANQEVAGLASCNAAGAVQPLLYAYPESIALRDRVRMRVAQADWSRPVSMEAVGASDHFDLHDPTANAWYNLAMDVRMGPNKYEPCRVVRFLPRFVCVNGTAQEGLCIAGVEVPPGSQMPFHVAPEEKLSVSFSYPLGDETVRTAAIAVEEIGKVFLKAPGSNTGLFRIDRALQGATIYVSVREESTWPFHLLNESSLDLSYSQAAWEEGHEPTGHLLLPGETARFSWDEPGVKERKLCVEAGNKRIPVDIYDIGQLQPVIVKLPGGVKRSLAIDIVADGPVLKVIFRDFDPKKSLFQYRRRSSTSALSATASPPNDEEFEVRSVKTRMLSAFALHFPSIGVTLINRHLEEILYVWARDVELRQSRSNLHWTYGLTVGWLQMDNQLFDAWDHPVLLFPAALSKRAQFKAGVTDAHDAEQQPPFLSLALIQSVDAAHGVQYFKYGGVLLQEVVIDLGEHLLHKIVDFFQFDSGLAATTEELGPITKVDTSLPDMVQLDLSSDLLYFELLQLHPIKISLSFSKTEGQDFDEFDTAASSTIYSYNPLETIANVFTTVVGSVSDAPLRFNALVLEHPIVRQFVLLALIQQHYTQQAISQVYRIIGSADFLGNPVGLFNTFGSGVSDFFYEPLLGLVSDRPGDIGIGLAKGSLSLVRKTVVGLTDTFAKVTGSLGKGATLLTFDPAFQQRRRTLQARNRPKHALGGVVASAKHLVAGITSGLTGIVEKPVEGAKEGGIGGFFKGVGVGVIGAVVKPLVGVFDATTSLTEGIKNTADTDSHEVPQIRLPRPVPYDGVLKTYSAHAAQGQAILYALHKREREESPTSLSTSQLHREFYVAHLDVPSDQAIALITTEAVILLEQRAYRPVWRIPLDEITYARPHRDIILLVVRQRNVKQRMIFVADPVQQEWFCSQVELAMAHYNEQRMLA